MKLSRETVDIIAVPVIYTTVFGAFLALFRYLFSGPAGGHDGGIIIEIFSLFIFFLILVPVISFIALKLITTTLEDILIFLGIVFFLVVEVVTALVIVS